MIFFCVFEDDRHDGIWDICDMSEVKWRREYVKNLISIYLEFSSICKVNDNNTETRNYYDFLLPLNFSSMLNLNVLGVIFTYTPTTALFWYTSPFCAHSAGNKERVFQFINLFRGENNNKQFPSLFHSSIFIRMQRYFMW